MYFTYLVKVQNRSRDIIVKFNTKIRSDIAVLIQHDLKSFGDRVPMTPSLQSPLFWLATPQSKLLHLSRLLKHHLQCGYL